MKSISRAVCLVFLALAATSAFSASLWKTKIPVESVQALPDGGFIIYGAPGSDQSCSEGRLFYVQANQNGMTQAGINGAMATVLTAFSLGKTVTFSYDNATARCFVNTVLVNP